MFGVNLRELVRKNRHSLSTIIGVILGLTIGLLFRRFIWQDDEQFLDKQKLRYLELPGLIFLRSFRLLLAPLLITSLTTSFFVERIDNNNNNSGSNNNNNNSNNSNNNNEINNHSRHRESQESQQQQQQQQLQHQDSRYDLQKVTALSFLFFISTSLFVAILGVTTVTFLKPGYSIKNDLLSSLNQTRNPLKEKQESFRKSHYQTDSVYNILLNIFPDNPLTPFFMKSYEQTEFIWPANISEINNPNFVPRNKIKTLHSFNPNMLGICVLSMALGAILSKLPSYKTETIRCLLNELDLVVKCVLDIMIRIMPYGMFCWMFTESLKMKSLDEMVSQLFYFYMIAVFLFLFIWFIFYPILYFTITRCNPFRLQRAILPALVVAAASCSSALALPLNMECMEETMKLPKIISRMVLPLGMTIHMNGPAMYYPMVGVFVSQVKDTPQNIVTLGTVCLFSLVMSMGFPGVPAGGTQIVSHLAFASVLGIDNPQDVVVLVLTFDWIFERIRTMTNVMGDAFVSKCVEHLAAIKVDQSITLKNMIAINNNNNNDDLIVTNEKPERV